MPVKESCDVIDELRAEVERLANALHVRCQHPDYEYAIYTEPAWSALPFSVREGWEINTSIKPDGRQNHREGYVVFFRRKRPSGKTLVFYDLFHTISNGFYFARRPHRVKYDGRNWFAEVNTTNGSKEKYWVVYPKC